MAAGHPRDERELAVLRRSRHRVCELPVAAVDALAVGGPTDTFGTPDAYHELVRSMVESGVLLDDGMIYFDARLSRRYPTVEIRVADVCVDLEDTLVVAALCRAIVDTAAAEAARGKPVPEMPTSLLRLAVWRAGHDGVDGVLVDPVSRRPRPWIEVMRDLVIHVHDSLRGLAISSGSRSGSIGWRALAGATGQRRTFAKTGLVDVIVEAVRRTVDTNHSLRAAYGACGYLARGRHRPADRLYVAPDRRLAGLELGGADHSTVTQCGVRPEPPAGRAIEVHGSPLGPYPRASPLAPRIWSTVRLPSGVVTRTVPDTSARGGLDGKNLPQRHAVKLDPVLRRGRKRMRSLVSTKRPIALHARPSSATRSRSQ